MSTRIVACANCGTKTTTEIYYEPKTSSGGIDLDGRPVHENNELFHPYENEFCPLCYYCGQNISTISVTARNVIRLPAYQALVDEVGLPIEAGQALCRAMIEEDLKNYWVAAKYAIYAAWVCDDFQAVIPGRRARLLATRLLNEFTDQELFEQWEKNIHFGSAIIMMDLYRRSGAFAKAVEFAKRALKYKKLQSDEFKYLKFQYELIKMQDINCHSWKEIMGIVPRPVTFKLNKSVVTNIPNRG